jgi:hypothetical protein
VLPMAIVSRMVCSRHLRADFRCEIGCQFA